MKHFIISSISFFLLFSFCISAWAADAVGKKADKPVAETVTDAAKDIKTGAVNIYQESKDAIVRDVKEMKEDIPRGLKEAKDSALQQSRDIKESASQELKEIHDNLANPKLAPKSDSK